VARKRRAKRDPSFLRQDESSLIWVPAWGGGSGGELGVGCLRIIEGAVERT